MDQAKKENVKTLIGEFVHTKKNTPAREFYKTNEFNLVKKDSEKEIWEYDLQKDYPFCRMF